VASRRSDPPPSAPRALVPRASSASSGEGPDGRCSVRLAAPFPPSPPSVAAVRSCDLPTTPWFAHRPRGRSAPPLGGGPPAVPVLRPSAAGHRFGSFDLSRFGDPSRPSDLAASRPSQTPAALFPSARCRHRSSGTCASSGLSSRPSGRSERCGMYRRTRGRSSRCLRRSQSISAGQRFKRKTDKKRGR